VDGGSDVLHHLGGEGQDEPLVVVEAVGVGVAGLQGGDPIPADPDGLGDGGVLDPLVSGTRHLRHPQDDQLAQAGVERRLRQQRAAQAQKRPQRRVRVGD